MYLQKQFHDNYTVLNPGKCCYMTFDLNTTKNQFLLRDGTIFPPAEEHVVYMYNRFSLNLLFSFEPIMQKG